MRKFLQFPPDEPWPERYPILKRLHSNEYSNIYLVLDPTAESGQSVLREIIIGYLDSKQLQQLLHDIERNLALIRQLKHPALLTVSEFFIHNDRYFHVMEYVSSGSLADRLAASPQGNLAESNVLLWAIQICELLDYLSEQIPPIVHRNIKPSNLFFDERYNQIKLDDFSIILWRSLGNTGIISVRTMGYTAPEVFAGKSTHQSDIYSLGATLFHLLTGVDPQKDPLLIFDFAKKPTPQQLNPTISVKMDAVIRKAVEHKPQRRFANAAEMKGALETLLR